MQLVPVGERKPDVVFEVPNLDEILEHAPSDVLYRPHNNGFDLTNKILSLNYIMTFAGGRDSVYLEFNAPKVRVDSKFIDMEGLLATLVCNDYIRLESASGERIEVYRHESPWCKVILGNPELFDRATRLLQSAARKYNLKHWYDVYRGKADIVEGVPKQT
jgi:hypothetical protein